MDTIISQNRERWNALANANVCHSRPYLDYTREKAEQHLYGNHILTDVAGKAVLLLAGGGGQESVPFSLLGADVTVYDLSDTQLARDQEAAKHYGYEINTLQGDMRDLSAFAENQFDIVWQSYSINYVPSVEPVVREVARVLKPQGIYLLSFANPYLMPVVLDEEENWTGEGYVLKGLYLDGEDLSLRFPVWSVEQPDGSVIKVESPHQYRHCMSTVLNTLAGHQFTLLRFTEYIIQQENAEPNSWPYFTQAIPPFYGSYWRLDK